MLRGSFAVNRPRLPDKKGPTRHTDWQRRCSHFYCAEQNIQSHRVSICSAGRVLERTSQKGFISFERRIRSPDAEMLSGDQWLVARSFAYFSELDALVSSGWESTDVVHSFLKLPSYGWKSSMTFPRGMGRDWCSQNVTYPDSSQLTPAGEASAEQISVDTSDTKPDAGITT